MLGRVSRWSFPFVVGVVGGLALFAALLVPVLLVQYRRFGRLSASRVLAVSAICVYAVGLVAYTFLPLPGSLRNCGPGGAVGPQLVPFRFVRDIARETSGLGWLETLTSPVTLQVVFNVALFVPLGLLVRRFGGRSVPVTTAVGLLVSLAVEVTQGTALWGLYACAYRVADVDDLLANTLGALVGALLARRVLGWVPDAADLERQRLRPTRVRPVQRWVGMVVDLASFTVVTAVVASAGRVARLLGLSVPGPLGTLAPGLPAVLAGAVVFVVPALVGTGASLGQRLVWLRPSWPDPPSLLRRLLGTLVGVTWALSAALAAFGDREGPFQALSLLLTLPGLLSPFVVLVTGSRGISMLLSGARPVDSRAPDPSGHAAVI